MWGVTYINAEALTKHLGLYHPDEDGPPDNDDELHPSHQQRNIPSTSRGGGHAKRPVSRASDRDVARTKKRGQNSRDEVMDAEYKPMKGEDRRGVSEEPIAAARAGGRSRYPLRTKTGPDTSEYARQRELRQELTRRIRTILTPPYVFEERDLLEL